MFVFYRFAGFMINISDDKKICYNFVMEKSCGVILYTIKENKRHYLLIKSKDGTVGFPKGHIEENESERQCALRETWEETSIVPKLNSKFQKMICYKMPNGIRKSVVYFLGRFDNQSAKHQSGFEHFEYLLLTYKAARQVLSYSSYKEVLADAESYLNQGWGEYNGDEF